MQIVKSQNDNCNIKAPIGDLIGVTMLRWARHGHWMLVSYCRSGQTRHLVAFNRHLRAMRARATESAK